MKPMIKLLSWNTHLILKPLCALLALLAAGQTAATLFYAAKPSLCLVSYLQIYHSSFSPLLFALGYLAALVVGLMPVCMAQGKARGAYTVLTFKLPRWQIYLAYLLTAALALLAVVAVHVGMYILLYQPTCMLQNHQAAAHGFAELAAQSRSFWWSFAGNANMRMLLPTSGWELLCWLMMLFAPPTVCLSVLLHRGWRRAAAVVLAGVTSVCGLLVLMFWLDSLNYHMWRPDAGWWTCLWVLLGMVFLSGLWSVRALHRAEYAV